MRTAAAERLVRSLTELPNGLQRVEVDEADQLGLAQPLLARLALLPLGLGEPAVHLHLVHLAVCALMAPHGLGDGRALAAVQLPQLRDAGSVLVGAAAGHPARARALRAGSDQRPVGV